MKEENLPEGTGKKRSDDLGGAFFLKKEPFHRSHARPRKPRRKQAPARWLRSWRAEKSWEESQVLVQWEGHPALRPCVALHSAAPRNFSERVAPDTDGGWEAQAKKYGSSDLEKFRDTDHAYQMPSSWVKCEVCGRNKQTNKKINAAHFRRKLYFDNGEPITGWFIFFFFFLSWFFF